MPSKLHYWGDQNKGLRNGKLYGFHCPGCKHAHSFEVEVPGGGGWTWNGSMESPTFYPSLLCNPDHEASRCHSFVTNGNIHFLSDCHHELAGKIVPIPDWEN